MLIDQRLDPIRIGDSGNRDFNFALASTGDSNFPYTKNALEKRLPQLHVADVLVPDFRDRTGKNPLTQSCTIAGDRQLGPFASQPPNQENDQSDANQAQDAREHKLDGTIAKHRRILAIVNGFFRGWFHRIGGRQKQDRDTIESPRETKFPGGWCVFVDSAALLTLNFKKTAFLENVVFALIFKSPRS